jgi:O-antigen/teichoic acid export membrane protein
VLKNITSNWLLQIATVIVTYVLTPFTIHRLGELGYGTWLLITSMTGHLLLLSLGVPMASVRYMTKYVSEGKQRELNTVIANAAGLFLLLGVVSFLIGSILFAVFESAYTIPAALQGQAKIGYFLVVLYVSADFIGQLPYAIMVAHHDFVFRNTVQLCGLIVRLVLTLVLLSFSASLVYLALIQLAAMAFEYAVMWMVVKRRYPLVKLQLRDFNTQGVRLIFSFSMFVLILAVGERLMFQSDALVIGAFLDIGQIPYYAVANSLGLYLIYFVVAIAGVVMPTATKLEAEGRRDLLEEVFLKWSKIAFSLTMMAGIFLLILGPRFLGWWLGPSFEGPSGRVLQILTIGGMVYLPVRGVALPILMGLGKPKQATIAFVICGIANVGLSILLARPLGLAGVAIGTTVPLIGYAIALLVLACREVGMSLTRYTAYVVPRALLGAIPAAAILLWFKWGMDVHNFVGLTAAGITMVAVYGLTCLLFVCQNDPYIDLRSRVPVLRSWRRA